PVGRDYVADCDDSRRRCEAVGKYCRMGSKSSRMYWSRCSLVIAARRASMSFISSFAGLGLPKARLAKAGEVAAHLVRWSPDRALQQVSDPVLQDAIGREPDRVADALAFEELVYLRGGQNA